LHLKEHVYSDSSTIVEALVVRIQGAVTAVSANMLRRGQDPVIILGSQYSDKATGWTAEELGFDSCQEIFLFSLASRPALECTFPPIKQVPQE
jgi:hypothetical protein